MWINNRNNTDLFTTNPNHCTLHFFLILLQFNCLGHSTVYHFLGNLLLPQSRQHNCEKYSAPPHQNGYDAKAHTLPDRHGESVAKSSPTEDQQYPQ